MKYNVWIGFVKSVKNVAIVAGIPAVMFLVDNWVNWMPDEYKAVAGPIIGLVAYFIKNYVQNK